MQNVRKLLADAFLLNVIYFLSNGAWLDLRILNKQLSSHLGKGEASCIAYASDRNVTVVTDDRNARKQCSQMNIPVTGTIGILKASVSDEHLDLDQADRILSKMIDAGFYSPLRSLADIFWAVNKTVYLVISFDYVKLIEKI